MKRLGFVLALCSLGCIDLALPETPPPPGPGTLSGTLVYALPGRTALQPAKGARVQLIESSNEVRSDDDGRFLLTGLTRTRGTVRISLDLDGDALPDRQRLFSLATIGAGPGRDLALGEIELGRNARLTGRALRADFPPERFHLGTTVFISGMEFSTFTADTGAWALDGLPEGPMQVAFFRENYQPDSREVTLSAGEERNLAAVLLRPSPSEAATLTGRVLLPSGDGASGATVRAVAPARSVSATSATDGRFSLGPVPAGVYLLGIERPGSISASLGQRLLLAGVNDLGDLTLVDGPSRPLDLDAGTLRPPIDDGGLVDAGAPPDSGTPDAGAPDAGAPVDAGTPDAGPPDAGAPDAGHPDAGPPDAGPPDAGGSPDAGPPDAGPPDAGSPDAGLPCGGLCAPGYVCGADDTCRTTACASQSCPFCNLGQCFSPTCTSGPACRTGDVCSGTTCTTLACAGVACASGSECANGRCLPTVCGAITCRAGSVCLAGVCVEARCVDRSCGPQQRCSDGACFPIGTPGNPCATGFAYIDGACRELACQGITCGPGTQCTGGQCLSGGLFVAGYTRPTGTQSNSPNFKWVVARSIGGRWEALSVNVLPPIVALHLSADGAWLFARTQIGTDSSSLWRSQDGSSWTLSYSGSYTVGGFISDLHVDETTGELTASITGQQVNGLHRVLRSVDNGNTWSIKFQPPSELGVRSFAPPNLVSIDTPFWNPFTGIGAFDGGVFVQRQAVNRSSGIAMFTSDPRGVGPTFYSQSGGATVFVADGGISGFFGAVPNASVYLPAPSRTILMTTPTSIARSLDHGGSWAFRAPAGSATRKFSGLVRGADQALYLSNEEATPPLFTSVDDGETWQPVPTRWNTVANLNDFWPTWAPSTAYSGFVLVSPTAAGTSGFIYRLTQNGTSGATEPTWAVDAGVQVVDGTARWVIEAVPGEMHPVSMVSRTCAPGQQRCGSGCVDTASNPQHCGACDQPCATTCASGRCLQAGSVDGGVAVGCADGTREGLRDVTIHGDVAACAGSWTQDLDVSASATALCAGGWHVCTASDAPVRALSYFEATAFPGCFAFRASVDGLDGCEPLDCSNATGSDDVAAIGSGCLALSGVSLPPGARDGGACFADRGVVASQCCSVSAATGCPQRGETGVVCCRD